VQTVVKFGACKMNLVALSVILSCCLALVYCDCGASEVSTVQQQWQATFGADEESLRQFAVATFERYVIVTSLSAMGYTSVASVSHSRQWCY